MKILYGIQSTGNGHLTRSFKIIDKLKKQGCDIDILLSGNNSQINLPFPAKFQLIGFTFFYNKNGELDYLKTFYNLNFIQFLKDIKLDISSYDLIISDFEPITAWAAKLKQTECIGISNQCSFLSNKTPRPKHKNNIGEFILKNFAPVSKPIGLHFKPYDNFILTPIIKDSLIDLPKDNKGHYCVYLPNISLEKLTLKLNEIKSVKFEVFTKTNKDLIDKNCFIKPIKSETFEESLRTSHGVITAAGFQTPSEALYLEKKLMVIPIKGQYEQECNAEALKGMGVFVGNVNDINKFIFDSNIVKVDWKDSTNDIVNIILSN